MANYLKIVWLWIVIQWYKFRLNRMTWEYHWIQRRKNAIVKENIQIFLRLDSMCRRCYNRGYAESASSED